MSLETVLRRLENPRTDVLDLLRVYQADEEAKALWRADARLHRAFALKLIGSGHPTRAFELVRAGLALHPEDQQLKYLGALALRRGGNLHRATEYVEKLLAEAGLEPEMRLKAISLRAALLKLEYARTAQTNPDPSLARESARLYEEAYRYAWDESLFPSRERAIFPGNNAATMAFMGDELVKAKRLAEEVYALALAEIERPENAQDVWLMATLGETSLLLGNLQEASRWYGRSIERAKATGREGDVEAIRGNFQLLRGRIPLSEEIWGFFNVGNVVAFAGHMIDHPARPCHAESPSRFPPDRALVDAVQEEIDRELEGLNARVGFCSLACGADILFAERMLERKAELHVVLPFDLDDFYRTSVDYGASDDEEMRGWRARCDRALRMATQLHYTTTEKYLGDDILFDFANSFILGMAVLRAEERGVRPFALAVADRDSATRRLVGGTGDFLARSEERGLSPRVIDLSRLREDLGVPAGRPIPAKPAAAGGERIRRKLMVMLFADVKNFSKLDDDRYPGFFSTFLDEVKHLVDETTSPPAFINTWGDGLYVAFGDVVEGADFALRLLDRVRRVDWKALGLPGDTTVRVGVHAGPVYQRMDPIIGRENVFGSQVNRAARIEPVTTPGSVFVSEQFAAALAIAGDHPFSCEYVGIEELAKGYDRCPLYLLGRR